MNASGASGRGSSGGLGAIAGRGLFGLLALAVLGISFAFRDTAFPWGPGLSCGLAFGAFALHLTLARGRLSAFDPLVWIPVSMLLFYFGRAVLIAWFGLVPIGGYDPWAAGGIAYVDFGFGVSLLALVALLFGIHAAGVQPMAGPVRTPEPEPRFAATAVLFALGAMVMTLVGIIVAGPSTLFGFYDLWYQAKLGSTDPRFIDMGLVFSQVAACALVASAGDRSRWLRIGAYGVFALTSAISLAKGDRTTVIAFGVGAGWVFTQRVARVRWRTVILAAVTTLLVMPAIAEWRTQRRVEESRRSSAPMLIARSVSETGMSVSAIFYTLKLVPDQDPHQWGLTFAQALRELVPNLGLTKGENYGGVAISLHPAHWLTHAVAPDVWAVGGGLGFAMAADWYYNFGLAGVAIGMALVGFVLARARNASSRSAFALVWSTTLFIAIAIWVRNEVAYPLRIALWPVFGLWAIERGLSFLGRGRARPQSAVRAGG